MSDLAPGAAPNSHQVPRPLLGATALAMVTIVAASWLVSCRATPSRTIRRAETTAPDTIRNWDDVRVYYAAIRHVIQEPGLRPFVVKDSAVRILWSVHWWPLADHKGWDREILGPVPWSLLNAPEIGQRTEIVRWEDVVDARGRLRPGSPLLILGPVEYMGPASALVRINLYLGPNGQSLSRILLRFVNDDWHVMQAVNEMNT